MLGSMAPRPRIPEDQVVELAEMFRLMSDPTRLKIILACLDDPAAVGEMADRLAISASLVSHHLRLLRDARVLGIGGGATEVMLDEVAKRYV